MHRMKTGIRDNICLIVRGLLLMAVVFACGICASASVSHAACCEVTDASGNKVSFDTFNQGWAYTYYKAGKNENSRMTIRLLSNWSAYNKDGKEKIGSTKYGYDKYDLGVEIKRKDVPGLGSSTSKVECFDDGRLIVDEGKYITIDLNGFNIDRHRGNNQDDSGELIFVCEKAFLRIVDSNPNVAKTLLGVQTKGGALMGGASEDGAGCIHIKSGGRVHIAGCNVCGNQTNDHGGAFQIISESSQLFLNGTKVFKNQTRDAHGDTDGGVIYADDGRIRIKNAWFYANASEDYGGVIYFNDPKTYVTIEDTTFQENKAGDYGGVFYIEAGYLQVKNSKFIGNEAVKDGGVIYVDDDRGILFRNCLFTGNKSKGSGGAIYVNDDNVYLIDCDIHDNVASGDGGGIYVKKKYDISVQGKMEVYGNTGKKGKKDDIYLSGTSSDKAFLYSGGLEEGSNIGLLAERPLKSRNDANKASPSLKNITKYEYENFFFLDNGESSAKKKSEKNETYFASVFTSQGFWIIVGVLLVIGILAGGGIILKRRRLMRTDEKEGFDTEDV